METPVLSPGGFWVCPTCGLRNKVWAPCAGCRTVLSGMALPRSHASGARVVLPAARRSWLLYGLVAAGFATAIGLAVVLTRLLGGTALDWSDQLSPDRPRTAATPAEPPPPPLGVTAAPTEVPLPPPLPREVLPATPPAAVYGPSVLPAPVPPLSPPITPSLTPPLTSSLPRSPADASGSRLIIRVEPQAGADLRARTEAARTARARFDRAYAEATAAGSAGEDEDPAAMERLEQAARELREAEAAVDRARRRRR